MTKSTTVLRDRLSTHRSFGYHFSLNRQGKFLIGIRERRNVGFGKPLWEKIRAEAENAFENKQFEKAYRQYKFILDNFAEYFVIGELLYTCGMTASKIGKYHVALRYYEYCFKLCPSEEVLASIQLMKEYLSEIV